MLKHSAETVRCVCVSMWVCVYIQHIYIYIDIPMLKHSAETAR